MSSNKNTSVIGQAGMRAPDHDPSSLLFKPHTWQIAFVQQCNLSCSYCCTGYGRFGKKSGTMGRETWTRLSDLVLKMSAGCNSINIEFGGGESFLYFGEVLSFLRHLRHLAADKSIRVDAVIGTNGILATPEQLRTCVKERISLSFSIDGPENTHDAFRRFPDGRPTHRAAMEAYRRYVDLTGGIEDYRQCNATSVVAGDARLRDIALFWKKEGVKRFRAIPAEPAWHQGRQDLDAWQARRKQYLKDMKDLAFSEASRLAGHDFENDFTGPVGILNYWKRLKNAVPYQACGAGYSIVGVGAEGELYPCESFVGYPRLSIGDVHSGVNTAKLAEFRAARSAVQSSCSACWARFLCSGGCCAGDPQRGIVLDKWKGCEFSQSAVEIAVQSYQHLIAAGEATR